MEERLQKILARCAGVSRRSAEAMIEAGRVRVNGNTARLGEQADAEEDVIELDGVRLRTRQEPELVYRMLCKPRGFVTTMHDEKGRRSVAELVGDLSVRVYPVGRLDCNSEGLLLLTNDGELANALMHPKKQVDKVYLVTVRGDIRGAAERLMAITELDGEPIAPAQARELSRREGQALLRVTIHQGKNRQIRRMCAGLGLHVEKLQRVEEDGLQLDDLPIGKWRYLTAQEIQRITGGDTRE